MYVWEFPTISKNKNNNSEIRKLLWKLEKKQTQMCLNEFRNQTDLIHRKMIRYHLTKSLILAQDERWRRA